MAPGHSTRRSRSGLGRAICGHSFFFFFFALAAVGLAVRFVQLILLPQAVERTVPGLSRESEHAIERPQHGQEPQQNRVWVATAGVFPTVGFLPVLAAYGQFNGQLTVATTPLPHSVTGS